MINRYNTNLLKYDKILSNSKKLNLRIETAKIAKKS